MSILDNLPHSCAAYRRTRTSGTLGGSKDSFPTSLFTNRTCWRQSAGDSEKLEFDKRGTVVTHKVYFAADPNLDERDVLVIGSDTMEVKSAARPDASAGLGVLWRVMAELTSTGSTP